LEDNFLHSKLHIRVQNIKERAIVSECLSGFEPARLRGFTGEVSPAYGIFHYVLKKKGKKQPVSFLSELLVKLITGWI
jgi:hypothetical protein